jgi:hypothetical protein
VDDLGRDPGDLYDLIGLGSPSWKPAAAEEKKKKADDFPVFEPPPKVIRTTQGDVLSSSKTQSKSPEGDRRKLTSADKKAAKTVSTSTQTLRSGSQSASSEVQTEEPDMCDCGIQAFPVTRMVHHSVTRTVTYRDDNNGMLFSYARTH